MNILGISSYNRNSAACLVQDGVIVAAAQEERFSRKKDDSSLPRQSIYYCLEAGAINVDDLDFVTLYDKPLHKLGRILKSYIGSAPAGLISFLNNMPTWFSQNLWFKEDLEEAIGFSGTIIYPEHLQSQAASAFFPSPFQEAAFLIIDGLGPSTATSYGTGSNNKISIEAEIKAPHSLGILYSAFCQFTGLEFKTAGNHLIDLSHLGEAKYQKLILSKLMDLKEDGSFKLNMEYFSYHDGIPMINDNFAKLFGRTPRLPYSPFSQMDMDLASSIQQVTEDVVLRMAKHVHKQTGQRNLCLGGDISLNCSANGRIARESLFDDLWIQHPAGESAGAIGAALFTWHQYLNNPKPLIATPDTPKGSCLGPSFSNKSIQNFLDSQNTSYSELSDQEISEIIADKIDNQEIIGWFQGRMELGPTSVGTRAIIGDARSDTIRATINQKIKKRHDFRSVSATTVQEHLGDYFDNDHNWPGVLTTAKLKDKLCPKAAAEQADLTGIEKLEPTPSSLPAITQADCSAKIQLIKKAEYPLYHKLLTTFYDKYGCGIILNTPFNIDGEPIVCTPEDAYRCFLKTELNSLIIGNFLIEKNNNQAEEVKEK